LVEMTPGTTAHVFAGHAALVFPAHAGDLDAAARRFDSARYLGATARRSDYQQIAELEKTLRTATPALAHSPAVSR
ncbi:MAG: DUF4129 domain-containing protein, partial [Mycobacterium sp.]